MESDITYTPPSRLVMRVTEGEENIRIGMLHNYSIFIGSSKSGKKKADIVISGDELVKPLHARIYNKAGKHRLQALDSVEITTASDKTIRVSRGRNDRIYDGDRISIGNVRFTFKCPGAKRPVGRKSGR